MENKKLKIKKIGRRPYIADVKKLQELYVKIRNKEITNEERLAIGSDVRKLYGIKWKKNMKKWRIIQMKEVNFETFRTDFKKCENKLLCLNINTFITSIIAFEKC